MFLYGNKSMKKALFIITGISASIFTFVLVFKILIYLSDKIPDYVAANGELPREIVKAFQPLRNQFFKNSWIIFLRKTFIWTIIVLYLLTWFVGVPSIEYSTNQNRITYIILPVLPGVIMTYREGGWGGWEIYLWYLTCNKEIYKTASWNNLCKKRAGCRL